MDSRPKASSVIGGFLCGDSYQSTLNETLDLSLCAHDTAAVFLPAGYAAVVCLPYLIYLLRYTGPVTSKKYMGRAAHLVKVLFSFLFMVLHLTELIYTLDLTFVARLSIYHALVRLFVMLVTSVAILLLSFIERKKHISTSKCVFVFWLLTLFVAAFRFSSAIMQQWYLFHPHKVYFGYTCFVLVIAVVQTITYGFIGDASCVRKKTKDEHKDMLLAEYQQQQLKPTNHLPSPESGASVVSQLTFWWMTDLIIRGWRKPLQPSDVWLLPAGEWSPLLYEKFRNSWETCLKLARRITIGPPAPSRPATVVEIDPVTGREVSGPHADSTPAQSTTLAKPSWTLAKSLFRAFGPAFAFAGLLKLIQDASLLLGPVFMMLITRYMKDNSTRPVWHGYTAVAGLLINCLIQTTFLQQYFYTVSVVGLRVRSALTAAIYKKCLRLSNASRQKATTGQTVNLVAVDASHFLDTAMFLHILWSAPLQVILAIVLLWINLGPATLAGLGVMVLTVVFSGFVARFAKKFQFAKMKKKDERIKLINEMLMGMKAIKLYAWEKSFQAKIDAVRKEEIAFLRKSVLLHSVSATVWNIAPHLVTIVTFAAYIFADPEADLDPVKAFVAIVLFNILRFPLIVLPNVISNVVQSTVSLKRIADYLLLPELDESAVSRSRSTQHSVVSVTDGEFSWADPNCPEDEKPAKDGKASSSKESKDNKAGKSADFKESKPTTSAVQEKFALHSINIDVRRGQLVAIVGQVGAGKSSLLSALLGEMVKLKGTVAFSGSCGYVAQTPWIQNATLKNNVLFSSPEEPAYYQEVLDSCALIPDLEILAAGDATEIGEKGINLSGGQKQRVALARAVYSKADVYLLDDPLSAVDSYTARHIFDRVIGPNGLLAKGPNGKKTCIWATHRLNFLPQCDHILLMAEGKIITQGTFKDLLVSSPLFCELIRSYMQSQDVDNDEALELESALASEVATTASQVGSTLSRQSSASSGIGQVQLDGTVKKRQRASKLDGEDDVEKAKKKKAAERITEAEEIKEGQINASIFSSYAKALGAFFVLVVIIFAALSHVLSVGAQNWLSLWTDEVATNSTAALSSKTRNFTIFSILYLLQGCAVLVATITMALSSIRAAIDMHSRLLLSITKTAMLFFESTPIGRIVNRFSKDVDVVDSALRETIMGFLSCALHVLSTFIIISIKLPIFLSVGVPLIVIYVFIQRVFVASMRQLKRIESVSRSPLISHFSETITGVGTIRAFGQQSKFSDSFLTTLDENQMATFISQMGNRWLSVRMELLGAVVIFVTALFGVIRRESLDPGALGLALAYAMSVSQTLNWMVRMSSEVETNIVAVERIDEYMTTTKEGAWSVPSIDLSPQLEHWPRSGEIVFENVVLRYREGLDPALRGLSFTVKPKEKVGIVGRTGAGKSSLSVALLRIVEISSGRILIDGVDSKTIGVHALRRAVTPIPQDSTLFSGTLRFNLDPFNKHTNEELLNALDLVHMLQFVESDSKGLDMNVAEGGDNLSAGQRQLICMARALLRRPSPKPHDHLQHRQAHILLMDEATAAVDVSTDRLITDMVHREFAESTVLTIAHRLDTVITYDRILVLANGQVMEYDTPANLLANPDSEFYKMAKSAGLTK